MPPSFNNQNVNEVALTLARRKVGLRHGFSKPMDKLAYDLSSSLQGAGDWLKKNPAAQKALIGAGVGGTLGLGSSLFRRGKKHPWRDALTGALAGGTLGGGIGLLGDRANISEKLFPSTGDTPGLAKDIEEVQNLNQQAKPTFLNSPLHWAGQTAKEHPVLSALGIGGGLDVGVGTIKSHGKNVTPKAWQQVSGVLAEQMEGGVDAVDTQIGKALNRYGSDVKKYKQPVGFSPKSGPGIVSEILGKKNSLLDALHGGNSDEIAKALGSLKDAKGNAIDPREVMSRLKNIKGVNRPMGAWQYALQEAKARRGNPKYLGMPVTSKVNKVTSALGKVSPGRIKNLLGWAGKVIPTSGINPKYTIPRSKTALTATALGLIASWVIANKTGNVHAARSRLGDIQQQFGN